jgi:hypothetical protein
MRNRRDSAQRIIITLRPRHRALGMPPDSGET